MLTLAAANTIQGVAGSATSVTYTIFGMELNAGVETNKVLAQGQLAASAGALYTVPGSTTAFVSVIVLANATSGAIVVSLYVNGTAAANLILSNVTIPANGQLTMDDEGLKVTDSQGNKYTTGTNIFDTVACAATTPLAASTSGASNFASHRDHAPQSPGGVTSIVASSSGINLTETIIASATIPANLIQAGTSFRVKVYGTCTSTVSNISTFRIRFGIGTTADTILMSVATTNAAASGTSIPFYVEFSITFRSTTVAEAFGFIDNNGITGLTTTQTPIFGTPTNTTGLTTNVQQVLSFTYVSAASTTTSTFQIATIDIVKM